MKLTKIIVSACLLAVMPALFSSCAEREEIPLVALEKQELPVVYFRVMVSAGSAYDPEEKPGLAYFTAKLLDKGTESYSRDDIENLLDEIGAEIDISVDKEVVVVSGKTLLENLTLFYPVFIEILTAPTFPGKEVRLQAESQLDRINQIRESDRRLSLAVLESRLFEDHRYGHIVEGTESAIRSLTKDDAVQFYQKHYLQGNTIAGVAGAIDDSLVAQFERDLELLPEGAIVRMSAAPTAAHGRQVVLVEKENRTQSQLRIGHLLDLTRRSPDYFALRLLWSYLGEHREMFGRIAQEVRVKRGLAYGAYAYTEFFEQAGWSKLQDNGICRNDQYFHMWTYPKEANFEFCIKLMLSEMTKIADGRIDDDGLELVRSYVANNFPFLVETPDKQLGMRLDEIWYDTPGFVDGYQEKIGGVSINRVKEVAERCFRPNDVLIVAVVSDGEQAKKELLSLATKLELPSGAKEADLERENDAVKSQPLGLAAADIEIVSAADLFK